ncbi:hypothetical protein AURDEDRAFT_163706 [Auricularia subglabra TFB-10046 SS5]|nr:hypothetical protein AURDEDRAFT_163706 [Auricularia subglabra TFB-10046 SS5]
MTDAPALPSAPLTMPALAAPLLRQPVVLLAELVVAVLEYLPLNELWTAARVSRQYYGAAWQAGLLIHRRIELESGNCAWQVAVFSTVVEHALGRKELRLSLHLQFIVAGGDPSILGLDVLKGYERDLDQILPKITAALPLLVHLSVDLPDRFRDALDIVLRHPAPRLRSFKIFASLQIAPCGAMIPRELFASAAPQLCSVVVTNMSLPEEPVATLRSISRAHFRYANMLPYGTIGRHLPNLTHLHLTFFISTGPVGESLKPFHVAALPLRSLVIEEDVGTVLLEAVERSMDLSVIPVVQLKGRTIRWREPLWTKDTTNVSMRICFCMEQRSDLCVLVVPEHMRWRRLFLVICWYQLLALPIEGMPNLATRLTYLRLGDSAVTGCLILRLKFVALRDLHIDIRANDYAAAALAPPDYDRFLFLTSFRQRAAPQHHPITWMWCPALERITLFALDEPIPHADARRVAFLAHALGQLGRPAADKAALELVGIEFQEPVAREMLDETVSTIIERPFAGRGSREDHEGGLWEHEC